MALQALHELARRLGIPVVLAHSPSSSGMLQQLQQQGLAATQASLAEAARSSSEAARAVAAGNSDSLLNDGSDSSGGRDVGDAVQDSSDAAGMSSASSSSSGSSRRSSNGSSSSSSNGSRDTTPGPLPSSQLGYQDYPGLPSESSSALSRSMEQLLSDVIAQQESAASPSTAAAVTAGMGSAQMMGPRDLPDLTKRPR